MVLQMRREPGLHFARGRRRGQAAVFEKVRDLAKDPRPALRGAEPNGLHNLVMAAVEKPLLDVVMRQAEGNQSKAAEWLGINRNTLRRKLLDHKIIK